MTRHSVKQYRWPNQWGSVCWLEVYNISCN